MFINKSRKSFLLLKSIHEYCIDKKKWFQKSKIKSTIRFEIFEIQSSDVGLICNHIDSIVIK